MAGSRRDRFRRSGRRTPYLDPKPLVLVVCEGEKSEPEYLAGLYRANRNPRVKIFPANEHGVPKTLVGVAKKLKKRAEVDAKRQRDENLRFDSVWCVFDIDDHPNVPEAFQMAQDNNIDLAVSNPCFELWLLLHFRDNPGMHHRDGIRTMLTEHVPGYDKDVKYSTYMDGYYWASQRAAKMDRIAEADGEPGRNPTTGVYRLTELIREELDMLKP